jgi:hypothetical protein
MPREQLRVGSLFTGYGGLDLAVEQFFDADTVWTCDNDPGACKIIAHRYPDIPNLGDITKVDWTNLKGYLMAAPRCDERAAEMYDLYCQGYSLEGIAKRYGCSRQSVYVMFKRRGLDLRPRPSAAPTVTYNGRVFSLRDQGYYRATSGDRDYLHRVVWEAEVGPIPEGWDIHHRDHDKTHNEIPNLECLPKAEHARLYSVGCNGSRHRCGIEEVMPTSANTVDILTGGWP